MDWDTLLAEVNDAFVVTSAGLSPWPRPRGPDESPREEEYSRCLDPAKYRYVGTRMDAWARVLVERGLATVTDVAPHDAVAESQRVWPRSRLPRVSALTMLTPVKTVALKLFSARTWLEDVPNACLLLGVRGVVFDGFLDCYCDACDWGSDGLLKLVDDSVRNVVSGKFLHVSSSTARVTSTLDGWSGSGSADVGTWIAEARAGRTPPGTETIRGEAWF